MEEIKETQREIKIIEVEGKNQEQVRQLHLKEIFAVVKHNQFIFDEKHKDFKKRGKRTLFWFETTKNLNKAFPNNRLNRN